MGKKSKKSAGRGSGRKGNAIGRDPNDNELPLYRKQQPEMFKTLVDELNPILRFDNFQTWICSDDDCFVAPSLKNGEVVAKRMKTREHGAPAQCPICFQPANLKCGKCQSVFYCSEECQKQHWKKCHKKACSAKPRHLYSFDTNIDQFRSLSEDAFEGHEFILIKPTEKLNSLDEICHVCLESADDVFETIPGFGCHQIERSGS